tara:strand:- start:1683 stop:2111 length:429 start_codon:yes stop_codon:yes gene_type:complete
MDGSNSSIFQELITKQRHQCDISKKLSLQDIKRISKNLNSSIFKENSCSLWKGYVTNKTKETKSSYINFYFRHRKVALHRLLYENYISNLNDNQYIKYSCENKGVCCNINHMYIIEPNKPKEIPTQKPPDEKSEKNLVVNFD